MSVRLQWTKEKRGRLFVNPCGFATKEKVKYGLHNGSSDLIGFEYVNRYPVFCCVEIKTKAYPKLSKEQKIWLDMVVNIGGRAYIAREKKDEYVIEEYAANKPE